MRSVLAVLFIALVTFSCEKDESKNDVSVAEFIQDGVFKGSFNRTGSDTSYVELNFSGNHFNGDSDRDKYPAICGGRYEISGSTINFTDTCTWTANFDWTLILNGTYNISKDDNTVRIWRTNGSSTDEYRLSRMTR